MIYRNTYKNYLLSALIFGIPMGVIFGLLRQSLWVGLLFACLCGGLFALLLGLFSKILSKKFDKHRQKLSEQRPIFCDGPANFGSIGGWLFFTSYGLEFYPHKVNFSQNVTALPLSGFASVTLHRKLLRIQIENTAYDFAVAHSKEWLAQIQSRLPNPSDPK